MRKFGRFIRWVAWAAKHPETLTPKIVEAAKHIGVGLCNGFTGWLSVTEAKLIESMDYEY
ncbi:MAG: hypothetical protein ACXWTU_05870 [Methylotenera sp.]